MRKHSSPSSVAFAHLFRPNPAHPDEEALAHAMLEERIQRCWNRMVGPRVAEIAQPRKFAQGVLSIHVSTSAWLQELSTFHQRYRQRLNSLLGLRCIRSLTFEVGSLLSPTFPASVERIQPSTSDQLPQLPPHAEESDLTLLHIEEQLQHLNEGPLKDSARRIMRKHFQLTRQRQRRTRPRRS